MPIFGVLQKLVCLCMQIIAADHDGTMNAAINILQEFGAINYLRYGSYQIEKIKLLDVEHSFLYNQFLKVFLCVCVCVCVCVKERASSSFAAVAPDMKLEQSINRFSQGPGGHVEVGGSGNEAYIAEFNLLFHEINAITNLLHQLTKERFMDHLETTVQHELGGQKGQIFDKNVLRLLDFVNARQNPFIIDGPKIPLHNTLPNKVLIQM